MFDLDAIDEARTRACGLVEEILGPQLDPFGGPWDRPQTPVEGGAMSRDWELASGDPAPFVQAYAPLRMRPGYQLVAYVRTLLLNRSTLLYALPPGSPAPHPSQLDPSHPVPPLALVHFMEAIEGDGSELSYVMATMLSRDGAQMGATWHSLDWLTHVLLRGYPFSDEAGLLACFDLHGVRAEIAEHLPQPRDGGPSRSLRVRPRSRPVPPHYAWRRALRSWLGAKKSPVPFDLKHLNLLPNSSPQDWRWLLPQPADWGLKVKLGRETEVEFYTYSPLFPERIFHHLDCYRNGNYRPDSQHQVVGEGPEGVDM